MHWGKLMGKGSPSTCSSVQYRVRCQWIQMRG